MESYLLLSIIKNTPPGTTPTWPEPATKCLTEMGIRVNFFYSLTGNGYHHFLHLIYVPPEITASQIREALKPFGVEGEVYIIRD
ncbi:MAG: hypothetical protein ABIK99_05455 [candidate division WOR-3 bacterium]